MYLLISWDIIFHRLIFKSLNSVFNCRQIKERYISALLRTNFNNIVSRGNDLRGSSPKKHQYKLVSSPKTIAFTCIRFLK